MLPLYASSGTARAAVRTDLVPCHQRGDSLVCQPLDRTLMGKSSVSLRSANNEWPSARGWRCRRGIRVGARVEEGLQSQPRGRRE